ncbi:unnamed protein product [Trichobilharzia regenti]|nr:unnamed protein product [Trichobilharzia regenti]
MYTRIDDCRAFGYNECKAEFYCYSIYELSWTSDTSDQLTNRSTEITGTSISRGCVSNSFLTMCTKKDIQPKKQFNSPYLMTHCCRDAWCNAEKVKIAHSDWSSNEPKRFVPKTADYSQYEEQIKPASLRQHPQFKPSSSFMNSGAVEGGFPQAVPQNSKESMESKQGNHETVNSKKPLRRKNEKSEYYYLS